MAEADRARSRATFDEAAERYDRARPGYPPAVFDDLAELAGVGPGCRVLEIGCGTGQAAVPLAERGCGIVAVELGAGLAAVARRNLACFPDTRVVVAAFEDWPLPRSRSTWWWRRPRSTGSTRPCAWPGRPTRCGPAAPWPSSPPTTSPAATRGSSPRCRTATCAGAGDHAAGAAAAHRRRGPDARRRARPLGPVRSGGLPPSPVGAAVLRGRVPGAAEHLLGPHRDGARRPRRPVRLHRRAHRAATAAASASAT
jgi:hypothetical protein